MVANFFSSASGIRRALADNNGMVNCEGNLNCMAWLFIGVHCGTMTIQSSNKLAASWYHSHILTGSPWTSTSPLIGMFTSCKKIMRLQSMHILPSATSVFSVALATQPLQGLPVSIRCNRSGSVGCRLPTTLLRLFHGRPAEKNIKNN